MFNKKLKLILDKDEKCIIYRALNMYYEFSKNVLKKDIQNNDIAYCAIVDYRNKIVNIMRKLQGYD